MIRISKACLAVLFISLALISTASAQNDTPASKDGFEQRLATLDRLLEQARIKHRIPGIAIAIVKNDEVVFSKGYGHRDLETKLPVQTDTLFAIGSSTKAFTSALVAMLVDEGKMDWDDPVSKFLPDFKMNVDTGDEQITIRDLLCHRTGFTRMGILWASGQLTPEEIIKQAANAEPYADFQEKFLYNNVMYMAAGMSAGQAADSDWDALIADRIFKPLGMNDSSTAFHVAQHDSRLSLGYLWDKEKEEFIHLPMRNLDSVGPSGSINSNVNDMTQWLRFQLSKGQFKDQRLLSEKQIGETWEKQMKIAGDVDYGFGWMLRDWSGKQVVEHGGSIDGFAAQVTLLPELNAGYVLLANVTTTPLQQESISLVFDTLFGDVTPNKGLVGIDTEVLVGNYIANFSQFNNATMKVLMQDDHLALDVPGQMIFELKAPDDEGKWYFAATDTIAVSFNENEQGKITSITMHQGGAKPEFIREDFEPEPETPQKQTAPLLGRYRDEETQKEVEIVVRKGRLVVDAGNTAFALLPPDEDGKWAMRVRPKGMQLRFNKNEEGAIKSLTRFSGGNEFEMPRVDATNSDNAPKLETLLAKIRSGYGTMDAEDVVGIRMHGSGTFIHAGARGTIELIFSNAGQHVTRRDFGKMAMIIEAFDGEKGFSDSNVGRYQEMLGRKLKQLELSHPLWFLDDWKRDYQDISITVESEVEGQKTMVVSLSGDNVASRKLFVAVDSGLILREETVWIADAVGEVPVTITYSDFRDVNGLQLPFKSESENQFTGKFVIQYERAEALKELPKDAFVVPSPKVR